MQLPNKFSKIVLYLTVLTGTLWTGAYLLRLLLTYQIFEGTELELRTYITPDNLSGVYNVLNAAISATFVLYIAFLVFFILFIIFSGLSLKKNGWLFIITVLLIITAPFEIYLMTIDYKILIDINYGSTNINLISELLRERIKIFGSFPLIQLFCYFTFYYLILFRPLTAHEN